MGHISRLFTDAFVRNWRCSLLFLGFYGLICVRGFFFTAREKRPKSFGISRFYLNLNFRHQNHFWFEC